MIDYLGTIFIAVDCWIIYSSDNIKIIEAKYNVFRIDSYVCLLFFLSNK